MPTCPHCEVTYEGTHERIFCGECGRRLAPDPKTLQRQVLELERRIALIEGGHETRVAEEAEGVQPVAPRPGNGQCAYTGPGRGDCESYIGLPGRHIPDQHDGDDTVDVYGKPNGWCWHCWLMYERDRFQAEARWASGEVEQLRVQLAGCLTAAEGATQSPAVQGDYGWSLAYQRTLELREEYEKMKGRLKSQAFEDVSRALASSDEEPKTFWDRVGEDD